MILKNKLSTLIGLLIMLTPQISHAQTQTELGEVSNFGEFISVLWSYGSRVIIAFAIFFIVLGAVFYIVSGGNEERIEDGRQMMVGSIIAIIITLLSGVLIRLLHQPAQGKSTVLSEIPGVITSGTNILVSLIGAFSFLMLVYAGILYLLGRGEPGQIRKAHRAFGYAVYGLIIGVLAYGIANTVVRFLV